MESKDLEAVYRTMLRIRRFDQGVAELFKEGLVKDVKQTTPVGRMVTPEDVANVVSFLCSEEAGMIRGQTIIVDGGTSVAPWASVIEKGEG